MEKVSNIIPFFKAELLGITQEREVISWAYIVIQHLLGYNRSDCIIHTDKEITIEISDEIKQIVRDLKTQKPLQYILGEVEFYGMKFQVNEHTLIPRPETEELVEWVLEDYKSINFEHVVIDMGTGSGCIAISLAMEQPFFNVTALDISSKALEIAKSNAIENKTIINFLQADITVLSSEIFPVNVIVSNPPYIHPREKKEMKNNVLNNEPPIALFVPEEDPLLFYRCILEYAQKNLLPDGVIYFEINPYFLSEMKNLILSITNYSIEERKDIFGKVRMLRLQSH